MITSNDKPPLTEELKHRNTLNTAEASSSHDIRFSLTQDIHVTAKISDIRSRSLLSRIYPKTVSFTVTTDEGESKICSLNIKNLVQQLGISRARVKEIARQPNGLEQLRTIALIKTRTLAKCIEIQTGTTSMHGELFKGIFELDVKAKNLHEIVEKAVQTTFESPAKPHRQKLKSFALYGKEFFVKYDHKGELQVFSSKLAGQGSFAQVFKVLNLQTTETFAVKKAKHAFNGAVCEISRQDLKNEVFVITQVNPTGTAEGLPKLPLTPAKGGMYMTEFRASNISTATILLMSMPIKDQLELYRQLAKGLETLHAEGYVHGDIKQENCLVELGPSGNPVKFILSDLGGAKPFVVDPMLPVTQTKNYIPADAKEQRSAGFLKGEVYLSGDVYALAKTITENLLGAVQGYPFHLPPVLIDQSNYGEFFNMLTEKGIPVQVANVLIAGLSHYTDRPNSAIFYSDFCDALDSQDVGHGSESHTHLTG